MQGKHLTIPYVLSALLLIIWSINLILPIHYQSVIDNTKVAQKQKLEEEKESEDYELITVDADYFQKHYDQRDMELSLNGDMYDVISYSLENGKVVCKAYNDTKETELYDTLAKHFDKHKKHKKQKRPLVQKVFQEQITHFKIYTLTTPQDEHISLNTMLRAGYVQNVYPPPEHILV